MENGNTPASPLSGDAYADFAGYDETSRTSYNPECQGLTKREHFAGLAMEGLISRGYGRDGNSGYEQRLAVRAVSIADALLKELEK